MAKEYKKKVYPVDASNSRENAKEYLRNFREKRQQDPNYVAPMRTEKTYRASQANAYRQAVGQMGAAASNPVNRDNALYNLARQTVDDRARQQRPAFQNQAAQVQELRDAMNRNNYDYISRLKQQQAELQARRTKQAQNRTENRKDSFVQVPKIEEPFGKKSTEVDPRTEYRQRQSQPRHQYTQDEGQKLIAEYRRTHPEGESTQSIGGTNAVEVMQLRQNAMQYLADKEEERRKQEGRIRRQSGREGNITDETIKDINPEDVGKKTVLDRARDYLRYDPSGSATANFGDVLYPSLRSTGNPMNEDLDKKFGIDRMSSQNLTKFAAAGSLAENNPLMAAEQASKGSPIQADRARSYTMMTPEEKRNYNAILALNGLSKAEEYHDALLDDINARIAKDIYEGGTKEAGTASKALYTLASGLGQGIRGIGEVGNVALGTSNTKATPVSQNLAAEIRRDENNSKVQNVVYDLAQSTGNMLPGIVASAFLGPQAGSAVFAFSQAGNSYREAINAGESTSTATMYSLQQGIDEMTTNFLLGGIQAFGGGAIKRVIQDIGGDAFTKALDRVCRTPAGKQILNRVIDYMSDMGSEAAQEYVQFYTENWTQALLGMKDQEGNPVVANLNPLDPNALYSALLGALNAGALNVPQIAGRVSSASRADVSDAAATAEYINRDLDITNYTEEDLDKAIRLADIAEDIKQKQEQGQKVSALEKTAYISAAEDVIESNSFRETEESKREEAYKAARENLAEGFGEEGKKAFNENIAEENRIEAYKPFAAYYNYGYHGTPVSRDMEKAAFQTMSSEQIDAAMRAGAADANRDHPIEATNRVQKAVEGIEIKAVKAGNIDTSSINMNRLTSQQRFRVQYAGALISKGLGLDVRFIESRAEGGVYRGINGSFQVINGRPTVTLDVNAGMNRISDWTGELGDIQKMLPIISHELTHYLEKTDSAMYKEISDAVITELSKNRNYTKGLTINQMISAERKRMDRNETKYDESGKMIPHSNDDAMREIVARACEDMLNGNETATKAFEGMSKRTKKYVWDHVKKVFDNIQDFFRQMLGTYESTSREAQAIRENMEAYEEIRKKWQEALGFATENLARQDAVRAENISMETEQAETAEKVVPAAEVVETNGQDGETAREAFSIRQFAQALDFDLRLNAEGFPFEIIDPKTGKAVKEVTEEHMRQTPMGYLIEAARQNNTIDEATADKQLKMFADLMNLTLEYDSASTPMVWEIAGSMMFSSVKSNSDAQYATTVDYGTICAKTQGLIDVLSKTMVEKGRGLTRKEVIDAYNATAHNGLSVPCPVCYVFSRWMGVPSLLETMRQCQVRFENALEKEVKKYINTMLDRYGDAKGVNSRKTALQNQAAKLDRDLQAAMQKGDLEEQRRIEKKCDQLEKELRDVESFNWVTQVRCVSDKKGGYKLDPSYKSVPNEILLDLTRTGDFASKYAKSWKYRVTRGAGMGKAIMPYSGATIGDFIKGNKTKWEKAKNVFFKKDIKAAKTAVKRANTRAKAQNLIGGQRFQSTSDFRAEWGIDYLMTFLECQAAGSQVQLYTKVIEAVDMFATAGAEVNLSIMPKDNGYVGNKLVFSNVTGIDFNEALKKTEKYDNVQMILVGINDKHIRLALKDKRISFVIPWHPSGSSKETLSALMTAVNENLSDAKSYEDSQNDKIIDNSEEMVKMRKLREDILMRKIETISDEQQEMLDRNPWLNDLYRRFYLDKTAKEYGVKLNKKQISSLFPYEYWDTSLTIEDADENGRRFQEYCASLGYQPRFSQFANDEGYWKLLIDRRMYNNDGTYHEPKAIDVTNVKVSSIPQAVNSNNYKDADKIAQATRDTLRAIDNEQNDLEAIDEEETNREQYSSRDSAEHKGSEHEVDANTIEIVNRGKVQYSERISDPNLVTQLEKEIENGDYITTYKAMQLIDGKLYPPMAAKTKGKDGKYHLTNASELGVWQRAVEDPTNIKIKNGKGYYTLNKGNGKSIDAAYNPYEHSSNLVLNDQFEEAYNRTNIVTVECVIPKSEIDNPYRAEYAKDATGVLDWKAGTVAGKLKNNRRMVYLSRYLKPVRILNESEVAKMWKETLGDSGISVPFNVVTPQLREALEAEGVKIDYEGSPTYRSRNKKQYSSRDSEGFNLTERQQDFYKESQARDENGNLLALYHGTPTAGFTEFREGRDGIWLTTSRRDADSYAGNWEGKLFDPDETTQRENTRGESYRIGKHFRFESEEDRRRFLQENPDAESYMDVHEIAERQRELDDDWDREDYYDLQDELDNIADRSRELKRAYRRYEMKHSQDTTIGEMMDSPEKYSADDFATAWLSLDSNAEVYDEAEYESEEQYRDVLADSLAEAVRAWDEEDPGTLQEVRDRKVKVRIPEGTKGTITNTPNNRTYKLYANVTHPYVMDARGKGNEGFRLTVAEKIHDDRYDGVIVKNARVGRHQELGTVVVAKNPNQVKLTTNENPTENADIRYSSREDDAFSLWQDVVSEKNDAAGRDSVFFLDEDDPTKVTYQQQEYFEEMSKTNDTIKAMNAALHQAIGEGKQVDVDKFAEEQAKKLRRSYGSKTAKGDLTEAIRSLCEKMNAAIQKDANDIAVVASNIGREVMQGIVVEDDTMRKQYPNLKRELKTYRILPGEKVRADMAAAYDSYEAFRRRAFGNLTIVGDDAGDFVRVDSVYQELNEKYPELFPDDIQNESEQMLRIMEVAQEVSGKKVTYTEAWGTSQDNLDEMSYMIGQDILNDYYKAAGTPAFGGVLESVRNDLIKQHKAEMKEAFAEKNRTIRDLRERLRNAEGKDSEKIKARLEALRNDKNNQLARMQQRYEQKMEKIRERRIDADARTRLLKAAQRLARMKGGPDFEARKEALVGDLDLFAKGIGKDTQQKLEQLKTEADQLAAQDENYRLIGYEKARRAFERLSKKRIADMTGPEVAELTERIVELTYMQQATKRILDKELQIQVATAGKRVIAQQKLAKGINDRNVIGSTFGRYALNMLNPTRAMARLDGYQRDGVLTKLGKALNDGQTRQNEFTMRASKKFNTFLDAHPDLVRTWYQTDIDTGYKGEDGKPIYINKGMRISLYLHSLNYQNRNHIARAGIEIPDAKLYQKGKYAEAYRYQERLKLQPTDIKRITDGMTADEKAFANLAKEFLNVDTKDAINETSMVLNGTYKATVDNYFPIRTDPNFVMGDITGLIQDGTIEGWGALKERKEGAAKPVLLEDVAVVLQRQTTNTAKYYGLAIPVRDFNKVIKWQETTGGTSVGEAINKTWGKTGTDYIRNVLRDIQTGAPGAEGPGAKLFSSLKSTYAGTVLNWNIGVSIKQSASAPFAAVVLDTKSIAKAFAPNNFFRKADLDYMDSITPWSYMRRQGISGTEMGEVYKPKNFVQKSEKLQKFKQKTNFIQAVDVWTTNRLFLATEYYVQDHFPNLEKRGPEYNRKVAELYNDMLQRTQPSYDVMQRNAFLRSDSPATKIFGMFKTQTFNMGGEVIDAWGRLTAFEKMHKDKQVSDAQLKKVRGQFGRTVGATIASQLMLTALGVLAKAVYHNMKNYRDDKGEVTPESTFMRAIYEFLTSFSGMTMGGSEAQSFFLALTGKEKWYDMEYPGLSTINDFTTNSTKVTENFRKACESGWKADDAEKFRNSCAELAMSAAILGRIPADNIYKLANALYLHVQDIKNGDFGKFEAGESLLGLRNSSVTKDQYAQRAAAAYAAGDTAAGDQWAEKTTNKKLQAAMYGDLGIDEDSSKAMVAYVKDGGNATEFERGQALAKELEEKDIKGDEVYAYVVGSKDYTNQEKIAWFKSSTQRTDSKKYTAWKDAGYGDWDFLKYRSDLSRFSGDGKQDKIVNYIKTQTTDTKKRKALWMLAGYKESSYDKNMN